MSHTKEPWKASRRAIAGVVDIFTGDEATGRVERIGDVITVDNARRIVACVNACAGLGTDALEAGNFLDRTESALGELYAVKRHRDELMAAAKNLINVKGRFHSEQAFKALIEAVAKVES